MTNFSSILDLPIAYLTYQTLVGGIQARRRCISDHVRPKPGLRVLDIGCGPGYVAKWFPDCHYVGLDSDPKYVRYANNRYAEYGRFFCELLSDTFLARYSKFDFVLMNGVLHHLDDDVCRTVLGLAKLALGDSGTLVTLDGYYAPKLHPVARFFLDRDRGKFLRQWAEYLILAKSIFPSVTAWDHPEYFYIPYTTVVLECRNTATSPKNSTASHECASGKP